MTERPKDERRNEELRERAEKLGWHRPKPSDHDETENRLIETERRKEQLQEAWRRRRTPPAPRKDRPGDKAT